ncbi:glycosyltransferase [Williamsia maris]|uniref:UDP:flavonoid glycosyltransferase YjiC, YdhE family n=1 Tax=Williamsia maris TaxID=72806 RepID=A0ABT1H7N9_9NOCA|nr:nucleotide disphospho-sugar-binding domain-containing protein [Williamsia maris]MCP2174282.1 UDP:flavonoid glycosyltransferase YjiC, YdhE family [Williamsia maris]
MRLALALNGSRGDVQPGIAVALEMTSRGHEVVVGVPENLVDFARGHGVDAQMFAPDTDDLLRSPLIKRDLKSPNPRTRARAIREVTEFGAATMDDRLLEMADGADLVVTGLMGQERGATVAEHRGARFVPLHYCPVRPSRSVPVPLGPLAALRAVPVLSEAVWRLVDHAFWWGSARRGDVALRQRLGMAPASGPLGNRLRSADSPEIQAYDPGLFPTLAAEWGPQRPFTGFVTPPAPARDHPSADDTVSTWLDQGPPPVYVGFGSMPLADAPTTFTHLVETIRAQGHRVLLCAGPNAEAVAGRLDGPEVLVVGAVDHGLVLPRCVAAVHHGGAGTTGACARAGVPSLIAAFSADQPMWGRAISDAGLGATCGIRHADDNDVLPDLIRRILDPGTAQRSRTFARLMIDPADAITAIAEILEQTV